MAKEQEFQLEGLEDRILLSATPMETDTVLQFSSQEEVQQNKHILIVDTSVEAYQDLINSPSIENTEIYFLDPGSDGLEQISSILDQYDELASVHIVSHGTEASLFLGNSTVSNDNIDTYADEFSSWKQALTPNADILFYGCDVGHNENGVDFLQRIAELTGADVAASDDTTGVGGDADLEVQVGTIETQEILSQSDYEVANISLDGLVIEGLGTVMVQEGDPEKAIGGLIELDSFEGNDINGVTVQLTNFITGEDSLSFTDLNTDNITWLNDGAGTLTLSGSDSIEAYEAALRTITYENTSENPSEVTREVTWTVSVTDLSGDGILIYDPLNDNGNPIAQWDSNLNSSNFDWDVDDGLAIVELDEENFVGEAYYFDGLGSGTMKSLEEFNSLDSDPTQGSVSLELVVRPADLERSAVLFETGGQNDGISVTTDGGDVVFRVQSTSDEFGVVFSEIRAEDVLSTEEFIQIIAILDVETDTTYLYIDGVLMATGTPTEGLDDWAENNKSGFGGFQGEGMHTSTDLGINGSSNLDNFIGHIATLKIFFEAINTNNSLVEASNSIEITALNNPPEITGSDFSVHEDCTQLITGISVSDVDSETLTVMLSVDDGSLSFLNLTIDESALISSEEGVISISGEIDTINEILGKLEYTSLEDSNVEDSLLVKVQDEDSTVEDSFAITIEALNDQPQISTSNGSPSLTEGTGGTQETSGTITVTDVDMDSPSLSIQDEVNIDLSDGLSLTVDQENALKDAFALDPLGDDGTADWNYQISDDDIDFLLAGETVILTYTVLVDDNSKDNQVDGDCEDESHTNQLDITITINGTNDAPTIDTPDSFEVHEQCESPLSGITVDDIDSDQLTVTVSVLSGMLKIPEAQASDTLVFSGSITEVNAILASLEYTSLDDNNDILTVTVDDDTDYLINAVGKVINISVIGLNDQPEITGAVSSEITEGDTFTHELTGDLSVSDEDLNDELFLSFTPELSTGGGLSLDVEQETALIEAASFTLDTIVEGASSWSFSIADEDINFLAEGELLTLTYTVTVRDREVLPELVQNEEDCQDEAHTDSIDVVITITGTNDAPAITLDIDNGDQDHVELTEDGSPLTSYGHTLSLEDPDTSDEVTDFIIKDLVIDALNLELSGLTEEQIEAMLSFSPESGIEGGETSGNLIWNFDSGSETFDFLTDEDTITFTYTLCAVDDSSTENNSDEYMITVIINGTNTAPTIDAPGLFYVHEDCESPLNGISVGDVDSDILTVTVSVDNGTLETTELGPDTSLQFTGTIEDVNSILATLSYLNLGDNDDTLQITVDDDTNDEPPAVMLLVEIDVTPVNDQPTIMGDDSASLTEGDAVNHTAEGVLIVADTDEDDMLSVSVVGNPDIVTSEDLSLTEEQVDALLSAASLSLTSLTDDGKTTWSFTIDDTDIAFLAAGEMLTLNYIVRVSDQFESPQTDSVDIEVFALQDQEYNQCPEAAHTADITISIKITGIDNTVSPSPTLDSFTIPTDFLGTEELFEETLSTPSFDDTSLQLQTILHSHSTLSTLTDHVEKHLHAMHSDTLDFRDGVLNFLLDDDHDHSHTHGEDENHGSDPAVIQGLYDSLSDILDESSLDEADTQFLENLRDAVDDVLNEASVEEDRSLEEISFELIELEDKPIAVDLEEEMLQQSELDEMRSVSVVLGTTFSTFEI